MTDDDGPPEDFFGLFGDYPWRSQVSRWPVPWRRMWGVLAARHEEAGMPWMDAEKKALEEVEASRAAPQQTASRMAGGGRIVKDPVAAPRMVGRRVTKAVRKSYRDAPTMFDGMDDEGGKSTTYQMDQTR